MILCHPMTTVSAPNELAAPSASRRITVLITDDQAVIRNGVRALLGEQDDMEVVGEAENGMEAVDLARKLVPDVVIMDLAMPVLSGLEATRQILANLPDTKVIIFSSYTDYAYIEEVVRLGAAGSLVKHAASRDLPKAIREVCSGRTYFTAGRKAPSQSPAAPGDTALAS